MRKNMGLYRGKREDNGEWVEGFYVRLHDSKGHESHRIYSGYAETDCGDYYPDWHEVIPETVGECSGLPDKTGKLIFEGDCINHPLNVVEFLNGEFCVAGDRPLDMMAKYGEIVCNTHDNPELLTAN